MKQASYPCRRGRESFRDGPTFGTRSCRGSCATCSRLINRASRGEIALVQVFHQELTGDAPIRSRRPRAACARCRSCRCAADAVFYKQVHSAMFGRTDAGVTLEPWLRERGIGELLITGIRTEQCCETTTRHASDLGFGVRYGERCDADLPDADPPRTRGVGAGDSRAHRAWCSTGASRRWVSTADALA